jgi:hypothetical protein
MPGSGQTKNSPLVPDVVPTNAVPPAGSPQADGADEPPVLRDGSDLTVPLNPILDAVPVFEPPRPPPASGISGVWLFVPAAHTKISGLYPPLYIELRVIEESGVLRGRYRGQYRVTDRAISPIVSFQFEGRANADHARLPWHGAGGAEGEVVLRLLNRSSLEVTWVANQLSEELSLISGTATLVRKLD